MKHLTTFHIFFKKQKQKRAEPVLKQSATLVASINEELQQLQTKLAQPALQRHINSGVCHGHWGPVVENCRPSSWGKAKMLAVSKFLVKHETASVQQDSCLFGFSWFHYARFICANWLCCWLPNLHQKYRMLCLHYWTKTSLVTTWKGSQIETYRDNGTSCCLLRWFCFRECQTNKSTKVTTIHQTCCFGPILHTYMHLQCCLTTLHIPFVTLS